MKKITPWALNFLLAGSLDNTVLFDELICKVNLQTEEDGSIRDFQMDNLKTTLKVALRMTLKHHDAISGKIRNALVQLLDYGTEPSSNSLKEFLASSDSQSPLVITDLSDDMHKSIGNVILPFLSGGDPAQKQQSLDNLNAVIRQCVHDFT